MPITVMLVDDQPSVRQGLRMMLDLEPDVLVVGEASDSAQALELLRSARPQIVVLDVRLAHEDGLQLLPQVLSIAPQTRVLMLSFYDDYQTRQRARRAGAVAFIGKQEPPEVLLHTLRRIDQMPSGLKYNSAYAVRHGTVNLLMREPVAGGKIFFDQAHR